MIVLHVLPYDLARGAQRYARALVDRLDGGSDRHLILTLFESDPVLLRADLEMNIPRGVLRQMGLDPRVVTRLRKAVEEVGPDVLVAHGGEPAKYGAIAAPRALPIVYLSIGSSHPRLSRPWNRAIHRWYTGRADMVVAVSSDVAEEARGLHGVAEDRVVVIPNGRDAAAFRPRASRRPGPVRLIFVGHLDEGKRPSLFVALVEALTEKGHEVVGTIVGEGPLAEFLRPAAESAGVDMLGRRDDVNELMADSDILVLTSRPPEGLPGVLIEAGLCAIPSVTTRIPGASDVVEDGATGLIVDLDDFEGLVEASERLVADEQLRIEMGANAREACLARFTLDATVEQWRSVLAAAVSARRGLL